MAYLRRYAVSSSLVSILIACGGRTLLDDAPGNSSTGGQTNGYVTNSGGQHYVANTGGGYSVANTGGYVASTGGYIASNTGGYKTTPLATGGSAGCSVQSTTNFIPIPDKTNDIASVLEIQVDVSDVMSEVLPSLGGGTRWAATQKALKTVLEQLPQDWFVGISFFAMPGTCYTPNQAVDIAQLSTSLSAIEAAIDSASVGGAQPLFSAWQFAYVYVTSKWTPPAGYSKVNRYIWLVTDPAPNVDLSACTKTTSFDWDQFITWVYDSGQPHGVQTFVATAPEADFIENLDYDPFYELSRVALVGGTTIPGCVTAEGMLSPCNNGSTTTASWIDRYDTSTYTCVNTSGQSSTCAGTYCMTEPGHYCDLDLAQPDNVASALQQQILMGTGIVPTIGCQYSLAFASSAGSSDTGIAVQYAPPQDPAAVQYLDRATSYSCTDGEWYFDNAQSPTSIILCPSTCNVVAQLGGSITLTHTCQVMLN